MTANVTLQILLPEYVKASGLQGAHLRSLLRSDTWLERHPPATYHKSTKEFEDASEDIRQYAQEVIESYGQTTTRSVEIQIVPIVGNKDTDRFNGTFGVWTAGEEFDYIQLHWASDDIEPLKKTLTHELGHHLRSFESPEVIQRYAATYALLQEMAAEALVMAIYGESELHHNRPLTPVSHFLAEIVEKETKNDELDSHLAGIQQGLRESDDCYPVATALLLQLNLPLQEIFSISIEDFAARILPILKTFRP